MTARPSGTRETPTARPDAVRDHLANERTLLAWQRTALALVGIGFLIERFALDPIGTADRGALLGAVLILCGAGVAIVGAYRFLRTERQIDSGSYRPAVAAHLVLAMVIAIAAVAIAIFTLTGSD
jgi:putative membrane protein